MGAEGTGHRLGGSTHSVSAQNSIQCAQPATLLPTLLRTLLLMYVQIKVQPLFLTPLTNALKGHA